MRKLQRAGAAVAVLSLVLSVSAFTREGTRSTAAASPGPVVPGGPIIIAGQTGPASAARPGHTVIHSLNWAGYAGNRAGTAFRYVSAVFQVPYLDCTAASTSY